MYINEKRSKTVTYFEEKKIPQNTAWVMNLTRKRLLPRVWQWGHCVSRRILRSNRVGIFEKILKISKNAGIDRTVHKSTEK